MRSRRIADSQRSGRGSRSRPVGNIHGLEFVALKPPFGRAHSHWPAAPHRAPDGAPVHYDRHRPEPTTLYRLVQQHAASLMAHTMIGTGSELPRFIKDEFDDFLKCGILAHGFQSLRCGECGYDKLLAFSCKRRGPIEWG